MMKKITQLTMYKRKEDSIYADYSRADQWHFYKEEGGTLPYKTYVRVLKKFAKGVGDSIVHKNNFFTMPYSLGQLRIQEKEVTQKIIDGKLVHNLRVNVMATRKLWEDDPEAKKAEKKIYYLNDHTDGKVYKFKWDKVSESGNSTMNYYGKWAYYFRPLAIMRTTLVKHLKDTTTKNEYFK